MSSCQQHQETIDQFSQANVQQTLELDQHLQQCEKCRQYKAQADQTAIWFANLNLPSGCTSEEIKSRIKDKGAEVSHQARIAVTGSCVSLFALMWFWLNDQLMTPGAAILTGWGLLSGLYAWFLGAKSGQFVAAKAAAQTNLFDTWRKDLKLKINLIKYLGSFLLMDIAAVWLLLVDLSQPIVGGTLIFFFISVLYVSFICYQFLLVLPRLKVELDQLSGRQH